MNNNGREAVDVNTNGQSVSLGDNGDTPGVDGNINNLKALLVYFESN
jgi:hypothetical protein